MKKLLLVLIGSLVLAGCVHTANQSGESGKARQESDKREVAKVEGRFVKGQAAPKVVVKSFDGEEVDVSQFYGDKAVLIDFWAGWCSFCIAEMSELEEAQNKYGEDLVVIGVHRSDTEDITTGLKFAQDRGVEYLLVQDGDGSFYRASGGIGMPVAIFIDKSGIVQEVKSGPKTAEEIGEKVEKLL